MCGTTPVVFLALGRFDLSLEWFGLDRKMMFVQRKMGGERGFCREYISKVTTLAVFLASGGLIFRRLVWVRLKVHVCRKRDRESEKVLVLRIYFIRYYSAGIAVVVRFNLPRVFWIE